jgi:hypothetical protein
VTVVRLLSAVLACFLMALTLLSATAAPPAQGAVYWGGSSFVGAANLDGTMPLISYPYEIANVARKTGVCGVAVNATHLYWADRNEGTIGVMQLSPSLSGRLDYIGEKILVDQSLVGGLGGPCGVAVDAGHVYWADQDGFAIGRANLDGSAVDPNFISGIQTPCGVAVDADHVYWGDLVGGTVGRAKIDGSEPEPSFIVAAEHPCGVAVSASGIYWSDFGGSEIGGSIGRASLDGSNPEATFIRAGGAPCGVAVNGSHIYWANSYYVGTLVSRANLDGSGAQPLVVPGDYAASCGVALDSRTFRTPPPPGSRPVHFGQLKRTRQGRRLVLSVLVPERGELKVLAPRLGWRVDKGPEPPPWRGGSFTWKLELWPGKGKVGKRIRQQLARGRPAPVDVSLSFEEAGRLAALTEKTIAFLAPPAKRGQ